MSLIDSPYGLCHVYEGNWQPILPTPTCIHQTSPQGYFINMDCREFNFFVCQLHSNAVFAKPPEGALHF